MAESAIPHSASDSTLGITVEKLRAIADESKVYVP